MGDLSMTPSSASSITTSKTLSPRSRWLRLMITWLGMVGGDVRGQHMAQSQQRQSLS